ncbi:hypothetical protein CYMTET_32825 [Cymbomonas tetramitiformis]|uniref:Uncharacterized protein n=1 Tax=Cymbomonas tetramitiformis TaxID=36881 RepID=A0AAE0FE21_9CHLO|nr:hypothetical protein CYMTET_32825 [Cymbomonas tetramitiformis]
MDLERLPYGEEAFSTKRLPLPRLEAGMSRDMATEKMGQEVHFWPGRRPGATANRRPAKSYPRADGGAVPGAPGGTPDAQVKPGARPAVQEEVQPMRSGRGPVVNNAKKTYSTAIDEAKKQVRESLAMLRSDTRTKSNQMESKEITAISDLQGVKMEWNTLKHVRLGKEEELKELNLQIESLKDDLVEDEVALERLKPERDALNEEAEAQEDCVETECRKGSMYIHMQNRAKETSEDASKDVEGLHMELASLARDVASLELYLRETRRLRAKSEEALNWMQENYNARSEERTQRLTRRRELRDAVGRELAETRMRMKELKQQWRAEADKQAMEEKKKLLELEEKEREAAQRELAEEDMRVKLERLAHTVGLKHRTIVGPGEQNPEDQDDDEGWTPEGILAALQAVEQRRGDVENQIATLQKREAKAWQELPESRVKLQTARLNWTEMWRLKLEGDRYLHPDQVCPTIPPSKAGSEDAEKGLAVSNKNFETAGKTLVSIQAKFEGVVAMLASGMTGVQGLEKLTVASAPFVKPRSEQLADLEKDAKGKGGKAGKDAKGKKPGTPKGGAKDKKGGKKPKTPDKKGRDGKSADTPDLPTCEHEELKPYLHIPLMLDRVLDQLEGVMAAATLTPEDTLLTLVDVGPVQNLRPLGVRHYKVNNPLGYLEEKELPGKYTTSEGFAVAGPHVSPDDDDENIEGDEKYSSMKKKFPTTEAADAGKSAARISGQPQAQARISVQN